MTAARDWRRFAAAFTASAAGTLALLFVFIWALDPYGLRVGPARAPSPIMDLNQRYMYPQIVRSGRFDSAVFGTSTVRLLEPMRLSRELGGRFANLGLNAGTPWEQMRLADLFLRSVPAPQSLIFGLDTTWCEPDADAKKLTFRSFPPWLYDEGPWNDYPQLVNLTTLEIAGRLALHHLGLLPERIRGDGYERFVPDEREYDLARARSHIYRNGASATPAETVTLTAAEREALRMPALSWLDEFLSRLPRSTAVILTTTPVHVEWQPRAGSRAAAIDAECKARIAEIGLRHAALVTDFRIASPVTKDDASYWDELHYRVGIADRFVDALAEARRTGTDAPDGFYRVLARPGR